MPLSTDTSLPSSEMRNEKPLHPLLQEPWPQSTKLVYKIGVGIWIVGLQLVAFLADLLFPSLWWFWHLMGLISGMAIGHLMTMQIIAMAIQERKNRV